MTITDPKKIKDIDARITLGSIKEIGNLSTYEYVNFILLQINSWLNLLMSIMCCIVKKALERSEVLASISEKYPCFREYQISFKEDLLDLIARNFLKMQ